jgi:hypothetical protein
MTVFTAYFDASGNPHDQPFIVVSGYIANLYSWRQLEEDWSQLHTLYCVDPPFHMAEFVAALNNPKYKTQKNARADYVEIAKDPERANGFLGQLSLRQSIYVSCGVSCIVTMDIYKGVSSLLELRDVVPPYALAASYVHRESPSMGRAV